jgi:hypothetical protein
VNTSRSRVTVVGVLIATLMLALQIVPVAAANPGFGAQLNRFSQPSNAEFGRRCSQGTVIRFGKACTWVAKDAFHNGNKFKAPKNGRIGKVKLVSCVKGSFKLQLARVQRATNKSRVVRSGPYIQYKADPRQVDGDGDTYCGGEDGDDFRVQTFKVNVPVKKGEYIAIKTKKTGTLNCSGGNGTLVHAPVLPVGGIIKKAKDTMSCSMLVRLVYK